MKKDLNSPWIYNLAIATGDNPIPDTISHSTMADFEASIQSAVDAQEIPGCVLFASNRDGTSPPHPIHPRN